MLMILLGSAASTGSSTWWFFECDLSLGRNFNTIHGSHRMDFSLVILKQPQHPYTYVILYFWVKAA